MNFGFDVVEVDDQFFLDVWGELGGGLAQAGDELEEFGGGGVIGLGEGVAAGLGVVVEGAADDAGGGAVEGIGGLWLFGHGITLILGLVIIDDNGRRRRLGVWDFFEEFNIWAVGLRVNGVID